MVFEEFIVEAVKDAMEGGLDAETKGLISEYLTQYKAAVESGNVTDIEYWRGELKKNFGVELAVEGDTAKGETKDKGVPSFGKSSETAVEKEITEETKSGVYEYFAKEHKTTPRYEELRMKSSIGKLTSKERKEYETLAKEYPERSEISEIEQLSINKAYKEAKELKIDFSVMRAFLELSMKKQSAESRGDSLTPQESDLFDVLGELIADATIRKTDVTIKKTRELLDRV